MLPGFQQYLVDKGFKRTCRKFGEEMEDYDSLFLSSYGPLHYEFRKDNHYAYWGLSEHQKPPVMHLGAAKIDIIQDTDLEGRVINRRTEEDGYRILFSKWKEDKYDEIYDAFISDDKQFLIDLSDGGIKVSVQNKFTHNKYLQKIN